MKLKPLTYEVPLEQIISSYEEPEEPKLTKKEELEESVAASAEAIEAILEDSGITSPEDNKANANDTLKKHLATYGATLEEVAQQLAYLMCRGESEANRMKALEFVSKMHGVQVELEEKAPTQKPVTININGSGNQNLIQFLRPKS